MRSRSCNFQKKSGSPARLVAPGPGQNRLKSKKSTCVPLKTLKLKVLWEEGTKLISIAKLHLEVSRTLTPSMKHPGYSPAQVPLQRRHHGLNFINPYLIQSNLRFHMNKECTNVS